MSALALGTHFDPGLGFGLVGRRYRIERGGQGRTLIGGSWEGFTPRSCLARGGLGHILNRLVFGPAFGCDPRSERVKDSLR